MWKSFPTLEPFVTNEILSPAWQFFPRALLGLKIFPGLEIWTIPIDLSFLLKSIDLFLRQA